MDLSKIRTAPLSFLPRSCHFFFYIFTIDLLESFFSFFSKFIAHYRFLVTGHGRSSEQSIRHCATRDAVREMGFRRPFYAA